ncbi:MAG: hypothetical protein ACI4O7_03595 [Aristaeellaceae bacterium]
MDDIQKLCVLYDRVCMGCGECNGLNMAGIGLDPLGEDDDEDDRCDLDPDKICDNCMKCITGDSEYRAIIVDSIELEEPEDDGTRPTLW